MSGDIVSDTSATYAVVDIAKKKKNKKVHLPEEVQESDSAIPLYDVIEMTKTSITSSEKTFEYTQESTELAKNEISMYEEPAPSTGSYLPVELSQQDKDKSKSEGSARARRLVDRTLLVVVALVLVAAVIACLMFTFLEVSTVKSEIKSLQQHAQQINVTSMNRSDTFANMFQNLNVLFKASLSQINHTLLNLSLPQDNNTQGLVYNFLNSGLFIAFPAASCASIPLFAPSLPSGDYWIRSSNGPAIRVYCDMNRSCGNITGGWMRMAELDMTDNTTQCPSSLRLRTSPRRTCVARNSSSATCSSVTFTVDGVGYSKVCGRIKGYQVGSPDAFRNISIGRIYVDGVSLTHGTSSRQHIWTFAGAASENSKRLASKCPCTNTDISSMVPPPPSYVGNDYFCDTAVEHTVDTSIFYADNPLWDGAGCGPQNTCCSFNNPPWFYKQLPQNTTDDIEMRVCRNQGSGEEDIAIEVVEIYVQ